MTGEQVRWGFENLNLSAGRPKQLGFENGLQTPAVSTEVNGARQKLALPCQRVAHDGSQVVEKRCHLSKERARSEAATICAGSPARRPANATSKSTPETRFTVSITSSTEKPRP